jgi:hypothetical protein
VVIADYVDEPLWDRETGCGPIDLRSLPLPEELRTTLRDWALTVRRTAGSGFRWPDSATHAQWQLEGLQLATRVQEALGDTFQVDYLEAQPGVARNTATTNAGSTGITFGPWTEPETPWLSATTTDRNDERLHELRRRAVDPVVAALLTDEEFGGLVVYRPAGDTEVRVWLAACGEQFQHTMVYRDGPTVDDVVTIAQQLADRLGDWVCETRFAWGQLRIARYTIPPADPWGSSSTPILR